MKIKIAYIIALLLLWVAQLRAQTDSSVFAYEYTPDTSIVILPEGEMKEIFNRVFPGVEFAFYFRSVEGISPKNSIQASYRGVKYKMLSQVNELVADIAIRGHSERLFVEEELVKACVYLKLSQLEAGNYRPEKLKNVAINVESVKKKYNGKMLPRYLELSRDLNYKVSIDFTKTNLSYSKVLKQCDFYFRSYNQEINSIYYEARRVYGKDESFFWQLDSHETMTPAQIESQKRELEYLQKKESGDKMGYWESIVPLNSGGGFCYTK